MSGSYRISYFFLAFVLIAIPSMRPLRDHARYLNWPVNWGFFTSHNLEPYGVYFYGNQSFEFVQLKPRPDEYIPDVLRIFYVTIYQDRMEKKFWDTVFNGRQGKRDFFCKRYEIPAGQRVFLGPLMWRATDGFGESVTPEKDFVFLEDKGHRIGTFQC